jgi:hypothetical protein
VNPAGAGADPEANDHGRDLDDIQTDGTQHGSRCSNREAALRTSPRTPGFLPVSDQPSQSDDEP